MILAEWILLAVVCLAGAALPGPSLALLLRTVIKDGRRAGVIFGLAHGIGVFFYAILVTSSLSIVVSLLPLFIKLVEIGGLIFLAWLALMMLKSSFTTEKFDQPVEITIPRSIIWHAKSGFLIVFLNPKITAFFFAIFAQFSSNSSSLFAKSIMVLTATIIDAGWYVLMSFLIAMPIFMNFLLPNSKRVEFILGFILLILCVFLGYKILIDFLV